MKDLLARITGINYERASGRIVKWLDDELAASGLDGYVVGLSGGLDSSVAAALLARARRKTLALIMPGEHTPKDDTDDAEKLARSLGIEYRVIELGSTHTAIMRELPSDKIASGNLLARLRMCLLYYHANTRRSLVVGTSDRSELLIGYFTKHGDGGADILPIASLYKTQAMALGRYLELPPAILAKKFGPRLWAEHTAEDELGYTYEEIDRVLYCLHDLKLKPATTAKKLGISTERVDRIVDMCRKSAHKRSLPKICKLK